MLVENLGHDSYINIDPTVQVTGTCIIRVEGDHNSLSIAAHTRLGNGLIEIRNNFSSIEIGEHCVLNGQFRCRADHGHLRIGNHTTSMWVQISLHEAGVIDIGKDCMFSGDVRMDVSDMHSILDISTGQRINPPDNISIGNHVWIGQGVSILKGCTIGSHSVLAAKAVITDDVPDHVIVAGIPAKVIREGISWDRQRLPWTQVTGSANEP